MRNNRLQEKNSKTNLLWPLLTFCLLLPLAFINIKNSHDWGDDFAMYLTEAKNIVQHKDPGQNGFIINPNAMMGPQSYPIGFPLILAPVIKWYGVNFYALNKYQSLLLIGALFFGFLFLYKNFSGLSSLLMTLVIAYNPLILSFKTEILSDIPFWCAVNVVLYLTYSRKHGAGWMLFSGALIGFCIHVRSVGFAVLISFLLYHLLHDLSNRRPDWKKYLLFSVAFAGVFSSLKLLFPLNSSYTYFEGDVLTTSANHLSYNLESICNFFKSPGLTDYYFITSICAYTFLTFLVIGFFIEIRTNPFSFLNLLTVIFVGVVIMYHFGDAGIRLILPLMFIFFYYFATAFKTLMGAIRFHYKAIALCCCGVLFCTYYTPLHTLIATTDNVVEGPCTMASREVFRYMKMNGIVSKNIGFDRPRALSLFTGNNGLHLSDEHLLEEVKQYELDYVLVHRMETSDAKKNTVNGDTATFKKIFANGDYGLFKINKP